MNLRKLRKERGLTQTELSKRANVHRVSISLYESGKKKPNLDSIERLATALNVKVDDLIDGRSAS